MHHFHFACYFSVETLRSGISYVMLTTTSVHSCKYSDPNFFFGNYRVNSHYRKRKISVGLNSETNLQKEGPIVQEIRGNIWGKICKEMIIKNVFLLGVWLGCLVLVSIGIIRPLYTTPCEYHTTWRRPVYSRLLFPHCYIVVFIVCDFYLYSLACNLYSVCPGSDFCK